MSNRAEVGDLKKLWNSLPSWISEHLGEKSYMNDEVNQLPSSPPKNSPSPKASPTVATPPSIERGTNIMTQDVLDFFRESYSFPSSVQIRLLEEDETIASARPSEVVFYEVAFHASLRLPMHPIIRRILYFYNIYPAQLVSND